MQWIGNLSERGIKLLAMSLVAMLFLSPVAILLWMTAVPGKSHIGALPPLTADQAAMARRLRGHVDAIAATPHNIEHPEELEHSATYIEGALSALGYAIQRQPFPADGQIVRNIEVTIEPAIATAGTLVIGAHYDSAGMAPGANDNGSGTAGVIELARQLADLRGKARYRIRLVLFVNEEPPYFKTPLMGSLVYAKRLKQSGEAVIGMMSLETLGFYSDRAHSQHYPAPLDMLYPSTGDFVAFVGTTSSRSLVRKTVGSFRALTPFPSVGGTAPGFIQGIDWSDHWSFGQVGIPALMVTDTAPFRYPHYHSAADTPDKVDYERLARVISGLARVIRDWR
ncbi:M28 family peptidase [Sphingomonas sp. ERG5]|uniref:M28 family peptidase n=1 Tax=Sphingomonas sp. ERG5 TaxID=1381597 RepID=UPI000A5F9B90|nr:M28 family peptidase [Sphingomonas sp. ERG5]